MPKALVWDQSGIREYETGISKVVLYPQVDAKYPKGVAWSGVSSVDESPSGAEPTDIWADNIKYLSLISAEQFGATLEAYSSPEEFDTCDGSEEIVPGATIGQQNRQSFGLSYQTIVGNDTDKEKHGYKIHLVYGCTAAPSSTTYESLNDSPDVSPLSWEISTIPVDVDGYKPTSTFVLDSTKLDKDILAKIEKILYGSDEAEARLPLPNEIIKILKGEDVEAAG